ncbi:MAG: reverse transcriptase domain-containing protein [Pseudomonadota bacterium]
MFKVDEFSLKLAIRHLCRYGDTDIFPHLPELAFLSDAEDQIVSELSNLDLDSYTPHGSLEALSPKSRYGFRIVHQLQYLDTLLFLACVVQIGDRIEAKRQPQRLARTFSYRFSADLELGQIFRKDRTFKDWLNRQNNILEKNGKYKSVVCTDISDFYSRINFHRLENLLDDVAPGEGSSRFIKKLIKVIRAKQSFGIPVGGSAARLLAELALLDTDQALKDQGLKTSRFVDDFRVFLDDTGNPYEVLGFLAEQLGINEGLSLNVAKTNVVSRAEYLKKLDHLTKDVAEEAEGVALDVLTAEIYFDEEPDEEDIEKLKALNIVYLLEKEIAVEDWDMGRIKVIFRALKITKPPKAITYIKKNLKSLTVFAKELCLLMEVLEEDNPGCFDDQIDEIMDAILTPPAATIQVIRSWLLEIFVRGIIDMPLTRLKDLETLSAVADKRQVLLIRGRNRDTNFFRMQKTKIYQYSEFERPILVWGASCLPRDEYNNWIDSVKTRFNDPLGKLFLSWAKSNYNDLFSKLKKTTIDHPS